MTARVICADVLDGLSQLEAGSVQTVVTSPPYWGLRDYGTATWSGGDPEHEHVGEDRRTVSGGAGKQYTNNGSNRVFAGDCACGASRLDEQLGLEETPELYVERMVDVFRAVRRVLRADGTVWLNIGDSYAGSWGAQGRSGEMADRAVISARQIPHAPRKMAKTGTIGAGSTLKPKDLVGIPWRVAFALQADGWWLRSDIIWAKPNPMPESVTDRPTKSHEHLFLLAASERYYYDLEAVREPLERAELIGRTRRIGAVEQDGTGRGDIGRVGVPYANPDGRNMRDVWTIATEANPLAHFATFPKRLVLPCVRAGSQPNDVVLDPFAGSGTVGVVALREGRSFVGVELNPDYAEMARRRIFDDAPLWNEVV